MCCTACWFLIPQPGTEPVLPAVEARSLDHWTAREVHIINYYAFLTDITTDQRTTQMTVSQVGKYSV